LRLNSSSEPQWSARIVPASVAPSVNVAVTATATKRPSAPSSPVHVVQALSAKVVTVTSVDFKMGSLVTAPSKSSKLARAPAA
jgi:hypothetical protein